MLRANPAGVKLLRQGVSSIRRQLPSGQAALVHHIAHPGLEFPARDEALPRLAAAHRDRVELCDPELHAGEVAPTAQERVVEVAYVLRVRAVLARVLRSVRERRRYRL